MHCVKNPQENLSNAIENIEICVKKGAEIISLPELFMSEYFCQGKNKAYFKLAEKIPGQTTKKLSEIAAKNKVVLVVSLFEKAGQNKFFNTAAIIGPNGKILGKYRKVHIPFLPPGLYDEKFYFSDGDLGFPVFSTPHAKIGALVCYDQWFPEPARIYAAKGAQILFYPTAIGWPKGDRKDLNKAEHEAWQITQRSHGIDNNVFVVAVNRVGIEKDLKFWGTSFVSDPYGRIIAKASSENPENLIVEIDLSVIKNMRKEWRFLDERRIRVENC